MRRAFLFFLVLFSIAPASAELLAPPYLQNRTQGSVDVYWVETSPQPRQVRWLRQRAESTVSSAEELSFRAREIEEFPQLANSPKRYLHHVTLRGLEGHRTVRYTVHFPQAPLAGIVSALPTSKERVRLIALADSETEPESTGKPAKWGTPEEPKRKYLVDQTTGMRENLKVIAQREPDALLIAGDLVESGGEQRDWDEFWRQFGELAGTIPLLPSPGNHEYYAGPRHGQYGTEASLNSISKYRTYFHPLGPEKKPLYYRKDLGLVTVISLDSVDGLPHRSARDCNHYLQAAGNFAPDHNPGSPQWEWLEDQLQECQKQDRFVVVMFHHCPYSSGVHGFPAGSRENEDPQSGQPMRDLAPILLKYGVEVLLSGHDEMYERSEVSGVEVLSDGRQREHTLQVYDVGIAGDGLRGPRRNNEFARFLAYRDAPEAWKDGRLISGGRHYGHLEIDVTPGPGGWRAKLTPVYILPTKTGGAWSFQRRHYKDTVVLESTAK